MWHCKFLGQGWYIHVGLVVEKKFKVFVFKFNYSISYCALSLNTEKECDVNVTMLDYRFNHLI